ncbi:MAG: hypothetical protein MUE85_04385 [Microscillaceae bacterium]|jgi:hypothetical protein|nr:hypothetical protein [Microscillaceae bacterium]
MKALVSILLAKLLFLGSLFPQSDIEELYKIPFLVQHYQSEHADLSFWDFLKIHYLNNHSASHSDQDHEKLPLQKHNHNLCVPFHFVVPHYELPTLSIKPFYPEFKAVYTQNYSFLRDKSLHQPPKTI